MIDLPLPAAPSDIRLGLTAKLFRGFADPSRLALLLALRDGERNVTDLVAATGLSQSNVSNHLGCLKDCGLVVSRAVGRYVYYAIADPAVHTVLGGADQILDRYARQIAACANYSPALPLTPVGER